MTASHDIVTGELGNVSVEQLAELAARDAIADTETILAELAEQDYDAAAAALQQARKDFAAAEVALAEARGALGAATGRAVALRRELGVVRTADGYKTIAQARSYRNPEREQ